MLVIFADPDADGPVDRDGQGARVQPRPDLHELGLCVPAAPWTARSRLPGAAYVNGILSVAYLKDSDSPRWDNDAAMRQYRAIVEKYLPGRNPRDGQIYYGVAKAETFVQALYKAGKNPTRVGLMNALLSLNSANKFLLPGVKQKTTQDRPLGHQPDAAPALQRERTGLGAGRQPDRRASSLDLTRTCVVGAGHARPLLRSGPELLPVPLHRRQARRRVEEVERRDVDRAHDRDRRPSLADVEHVDAAGACSKWPRNMRSAVSA